MRRNRTRWLALATMVVAAPLLWGSSAQAQQVEADATVTFTGGCVDRPGFAAGATADQTAVTVRVGGQLEFVNQLGIRATLLVDGEPAVELSPGGAVVVAFYEGPVEVTMRITCPRGELAATTMIGVGADPPQPDQAPAAPSSVSSPGDLHTPQWTPPSPGGNLSPGPEAAVVADGSGSSGGPNGLLAILATVCVAGVSAAAIRVILAQRTAAAEPA
jgi:hypothetical protein